MLLKNLCLVFKFSTKIDEKNNFRYKKIFIDLYIWLFDFRDFIIGIYQKYRIFWLLIDLIEIFYTFMLDTLTNILCES